MAVTFSSSHLTEIVPKTPIGGGLCVSAFAGSFNGTNPTFTGILPSASVAQIVPMGTPINTTDGTIKDRILCNNSLNSSGFFSSLSATTNSLDIVVSFTRGGTNPQDFNVLIISKG